MTVKRDLHLSGNIVREAFQKAMEECPGPFNLSGRGHEPRCTFDVKLSAILRPVDLPHVRISGFGAKKHYPMRLVDRAAFIVNERMGKEVIKKSLGAFYICSE